MIDTCKTCDKLQNDIKSASHDDERKTKEGEKEHRLALAEKGYNQKRIDKTIGDCCQFVHTIRGRTEFRIVQMQREHFLLYSSLFRSIFVFVFYFFNLVLIFFIIFFLFLCLHLIYFGMIQRYYDSE